MANYVKSIKITTPDHSHSQNIHEHENQWERAKTTLDSL